MENNRKVRPGENAVVIGYAIFAFAVIAGCTVQTRHAKITVLTDSVNSYSSPGGLYENRSTISPYAKDAFGVLPYFTDAPAYVKLGATALPAVKDFAVEREKTKQKRIDLDISRERRL